MTSIALISDIHANALALDAVLADIRARGCDRILCLGDLVGYGPRPGEVIACIRTENIETVMGNYDEAVGFTLPACGCHIDNPRQKALSRHSLHWAIAHTTPQERAFLRSLPETLSVEVEGISFCLTHATPDSITEYLYQADAARMAEIIALITQDVYVYGHTHLPFHAVLGGKHILNAGSVGRPKDFDTRAGYMLAQVHGQRLRAEVVRVPYDVAQVVREMAAQGIDEAFGRFLLDGGEGETQRRNP
jgi:putative phosphoesterase